MKTYKFFKEHSVETGILIFFLTYVSLWVIFNFETVKINNNNLNDAINLHKFNPYFSYFLFKISNFLNLQLILGYIVFPSLVVTILYKIFFKLTGSNYWSISLILLSIISTENFPFISFLTNLHNPNELQNYYNLYENFEIQGFPIPSFSIFYFCFLFYYYFRTIRFDEKGLYIFSFFWFMGPFVHPFDGLIGLIFWNTNLFLNSKLKNIAFKKKFILYLIISNIVVGLLLINQVNFDNQILFSNQYYPFYNIFVYFILPIVLIINCIFFFKVDFYEFYQKFLPIYILLLIEVVMILCSIFGFGFDIKMTETRITMFLLHFLYYMPIIYYLNKDNFFLISYSDKRNSFNNYTKKVIYFIFCKFNKVYLSIFSFLIIFYLINSLKI